jgi:hypothetical protein
MINETMPIIKIFFILNHLPKLIIIIYLKLGNLTVKASLSGLLSLLGLLSFTYLDVFSKSFIHWGISDIGPIELLRRGGLQKGKSREKKTPFPP